jgi:hypothetical protein
MEEVLYLAVRKDCEAQSNVISEALKTQGRNEVFAWTSQDSAATGQHVS